MAVAEEICSPFNYLNCWWFVDCLSHKNKQTNEADKQTNAKRHIKNSPHNGTACVNFSIQPKEKEPFKPWLSKRHLNGFNLPH